MRRDAPDSIPARVYTRAVAQETLRLADEVVKAVREKLRLNKRGGQR